MIKKLNTVSHPGHQSKANIACLRWCTRECRIMGTDYSETYSVNYFNLLP